MQRDTSLTFGDIHGSPDALLASVKEIENLALIEQPSTTKPLQIRLLEIVDDEQTSTRILYLTDLAEPRPTQKWITVSYCWAHSEAPAALTYDYYIQSSSGLLRRPACPLMVLHRAVQFARSRDCRYIWIDQECIDQSDEKDIENHLQVMHRIYSCSWWTVALLACRISAPSLMNAVLDIYAKAPSIETEEAPLDDPLDDPRRRVLRYILDDPWFKRAWTFQERQLAHSLYISIPTSSSCAQLIDIRSVKMFVDDDFCFSSRMLRHQLYDLESSDLERNLRWYAGASYSPQHSWQSFLKYFQQVEAPSVDVFLTGGLFPMLERCEISILADRLAIYGNVCDMSNKLKTTILRNSTHSYSTCLLVLVMAYLWPEHDERMKAYLDISVSGMDMTIERVFVRLEYIWHRGFDNGG